MKGYTSERIMTEAPEALPTVQNLYAHYKAYGLDARNKKGVSVRYTAYGPFSKDALVEVGRARLSEDAFVQLIGLLGYDEFIDKARADWAKVREET